MINEDKIERLEMRIFVIGATGHTGTQIVDLALSRGHEVTAFVRSPHKIGRQDPRLKVLAGDPHNVEQLTSALLLKKGRIARPYLGIAMQPVKVPESIRSKLPADTRVGLIVMHVDNGAPAENAGVLLGDVLFEVGGKTVEHVDAIQDSLAIARIGDVLQIRVIRAGEIKPVSITLGERA
jgi:hypothetical protein